MFCGLTARKKKTGAFPVYLNVYDLTPINGYAYWVGLGVYHSGVQVHDVEYAFGAHEHTHSGVFEVEPKKCPGFTFRKSILIGRTDLSPKDARIFMQKLSAEYSGNTYHLIRRNCNHFCNDACVRLTGKQIPSWVNRLARFGIFCNCVIPASINEAQVRQVRSGGDKARDPEKRRLRSQSTKLASSSTSSTLLTSHSSRSCRQSRFMPPSSNLTESPGAAVKDLIKPVRE